MRSGIYDWVYRFFCLISEFKGVKTILRSILTPTLFFFIQLYFFILFLQLKTLIYYWLEWMKVDEVSMWAIYQMRSPSWYSLIRLCLIYSTLNIMYTFFAARKMTVRNTANTALSNKYSISIDSLVHFNLFIAFQSWPMWTKVTCHGQTS